MQALTPDTVTLATSPGPLPPTDSLLPQSLYFLKNDNAGFMQVYRLDPDGKTTRQITFEPSNVESYDVSPKDGSVAYTSNNQLLLVNSDGAGRNVLVDGGPLDSDDAYITRRVGGVVWSPDGETIAFGFGGLNFYALSSGGANRVLENLVDTSPGIPILREGYAPVAYAPDGRKLLVNIAYYEGGVYAIYYLDGGTLVRSPENPVSCCVGSWSPDGSVYYAASPYLGLIAPGLWRINADGTVVALLGIDSSQGGPIHFAQSPILGPDGRLYFFYNSVPSVEEVTSRTPLFMVSSEQDGVSDRVNLLPTPFDPVNEILWAPDASFAVMAFAPLPEVYQGGRVEMVYTDGRPRITLVPFAQDMRWGP
jgi:WD40 repeat protein